MANNNDSAARNNTSNNLPIFPPGSTAKAHNWASNESSNPSPMPANNINNMPMFPPQDGKAANWGSNGNVAGPNYTHPAAFPPSQPYMSMPPQSPTPGATGPLPPHSQQAPYPAYPYQQSPYQQPSGPGYQQQPPFQPGYQPQQPHLHSSYAQPSSFQSFAPNGNSHMSASYGASFPSSPAMNPHSSVSSQPIPPQYTAQMNQQPNLTGHNSIYAGPAMPNPYVAGVANIKASEVKLEISCKNLRDRDIISKSDPCAVIFLEEKRYGAPSGYPGMPGSLNNLPPQAQQLQYLQFDQPSAASPNEVSQWREIGRTEAMRDNLNPHFSVHVKVPYRFEELQNIRIGIWDIDTRSKELHTHDFLGDIRTTLGDLVASGITEKPLTYPKAQDNKTIMGGKRSLGSITVIVHEIRDGGKLLIKGRFSGRKLAKRDLFTSDPYINFTQLKGNSSRSQVYTTEVVRKNRNPVWRPVKFKVDRPNGAEYSHIRLELLCNDSDQLKRDDEIGTAHCTLEELLKVDRLPLMYHPRRRLMRMGSGGNGNKGKPKAAGEIICQDVTVSRMPSLSEYLTGGLKLHFSVAIDLTASNGDPRDPNSLHYQQNGYDNQYVRALKSIGDILAHYAPSDGMFAAYGFGAELPGQTGVASSCFPLSLSQDPKCFGINGVVDAYQRVLHNVRLSGPTNFSPLIEEATRNSAARENDANTQNYDVLLILTDGVVTDFNRTVEKIIDASFTAPLSIIIVGVGQADFEKMRRLDADNQLLTTMDGTRKAARDIVQFVPFRDFVQQTPDRLAATVLAEMPDNIVDYFISSRNPAIMPKQIAMRPDGRS